MAHLIDLSNSRANMAYVGETPWHGLGQKLTEKAPIEIWAQEAGMSHSVERAPVRFSTDTDLGLVDGLMEDREVLYRSDNKMPLAVVSQRYNIHQPQEILEFFRDLVGATGEYDLETAGCLNDGKKYWALAKHRSQLNFGGDVVLPYLMLATSVDGTMATTAQHTSVRVVCNNTLQMSLSADSAAAVKVNHSSKFDAADIKDQLGVTNAIADYRANVELLIDKAINQAQTVELLVDLVAKREGEEITNEKHTKKVVGEIMDSLYTGPGANLEAARGTSWGVMNAVTHYVDFKAGAKSNNNRFSSGQFGAGANFKKQAFQALVAA